jgi:hypothetical protein
MNFFNDIGRGFQDFGNAINNEVIKPVGNELSKAQDLPKQIENLPNKIESQINNELNKIDPKLNLKDLPKQIENLPNKIETQINNELKKINPRLKLPPKPKIPPPRILKPDEINKIIKNGFEDTILKPVVSGFEKDIINPSKTIADNIKTGFQKDIIDGFKKDVIGGFQKDIIDGFQKDIINPSKVLFDSIGDTLNQGKPKGSNNINNDGSYDLIIYAGLGLLVAYIIIK